MAINTPARIKLDSAVKQVPAATTNATTELLQAVARHRDRAAFVTRVLKALAKVTATAEPDKAHQAESDYAVLVRFLEQPDVLAALRQEDPLISARLRGIRMRERLLASEGGVCSTKEMAEALGITRQAVDKRRKSGTLIGVQLGRRGYMYPAWQIDLEGLDSVLAELSEFDPWTQLAFMLAPNSWLNGETPLDVLRGGEIARAVEAAQFYGEQIAA